MHLLSFRLRSKDFLVNSVSLQQLFVCADAINGAVVQHQDGIGVLYGGYPLRDNDPRYV